MSTRADTGRTAAVASFGGDNGSREHYLVVEPATSGDFASQLASVTQQYTELLRTLDLAPQSAIFRRLYVSDVQNQVAAVRASPLMAEEGSGPVAVSVVQQPPLPANKVALLAYHVDGDASMTKRRLSPNLVEVRKAGQRHLWITGLRTGRADAGVSSHDETTTLLQLLTDLLAGRGGTLAANCVRTWLYVKDVDVFYQGLVESRAAFFSRHGLTRNSHYIASTGIEGACGGRYEVVALDAYSLLGPAAKQVSYLNAFDLICATHDYGVTFERGTSVAYADRAHHFISGTASIDSRGRVVHPGNVLRQLGRALQNVEGLLRSGGATFAEMMHLTVYLRDFTDFAMVRDCLKERFPTLPVLVVLAPVCRPEWLIEVEGVAIAPSDQPGLAAF